MRAGLEKLLRYESIQRVRDDLALKSNSETSLKTYLSWIHRFLRRFDTSPDQLVDSFRSSELDATQEYNKFLVELNESGLAKYTIAGAGVSVRKFFKVNQINLGEIHKVKTWTKHEDRAPTVGELRKIFNYADLREKAVLSFLASSGVRTGTLTRLKLKDIELDEDGGISRVRVRAESSKTRRPYTTFITSEATKLLNEYIQYRARSGEPTTPDTPIIRDAFDMRRRGSVTKVETLSPNTIEKIIRNLLRKTGLIPESDGDIRKRYELHTHSFRKFFATQLAAVGVQDSFKEYFLGHSGGLDRSYFRPTKEQLRDAYLLAESSLTIQPTPREGVSGEILRLTALRESMSVFGRRFGIDDETITKITSSIDESIEKRERGEITEEELETFRGEVYHYFDQFNSVLEAPFSRPDYEDQFWTYDEKGEFVFDDKTRLEDLRKRDDFLERKDEFKAWVKKQGYNIKVDFENIEFWWHEFINEYREKQGKPPKYEISYVKHPDECPGGGWEVVAPIADRKGRVKIIRDLDTGKKCPKCSEPITTDMKRCPRCWTPLNSKKCPKCGRELAEHYKGCPYCGIEL